MCDNVRMHGLAFWIISMAFLALATSFGCGSDGGSSSTDGSGAGQAGGGNGCVPVTESCDGIDNDCDGETDEDSIPAAQQECTTGRAGVCAAGTNNCIHGKVECVGNVRPGPEICNKKDDNCNGDIDEDCVTEAEAAKIREQSK
jgi:hypothetical protein